MTQNQIAYAKVLEDQRHNRELEKVQQTQVAETQRHDLAVEYETNRSNLVSEGIMQFNATTNSRNADTNARNADTNAFNATVNSWNAAINERNAATNERNAATNERNAAINAENAISNRIQANAAAQNANTNAWAAAQQAGIGWSNVAVNEQNARINQQNADTASKNADTAWYNAQTAYSDFISQSLLRESQIDVNTANARRTEDLLPYEKWNYATGSAENVTQSLKNVTGAWSDLGKSDKLNNEMSNLIQNIGLLAIRLVGG